MSDNPSPDASAESQDKETPATEKKSVPNEIPKESSYEQSRDFKNSMPINYCSDEKVSRENKRTSVTAVLALIIAGLALAILIYFIPNIKYQLNSMNSEMNAVSGALQSVNNKLADVDQMTKGLKNRLGDYEKMTMIIELKRALHTLEGISQNAPESTLQKTELIRESILSLLNDLGNESRGTGSKSVQDVEAKIDQEIPVAPDLLPLREESTGIKVIEPEWEEFKAPEEQTSQQEFNKTTQGAEDFGEINLRQE